MFVASPHNPHHQTGKPAPLIAEDVYAVIMANKERLNAAVKPEYDYDYDFFGFKTLERSYLLKLNGKIAERPCYMLMRVSVGLHKDDIDAAIETYTLMSQRYFTHASPTLFNSGTPKPQMSSCFLMQMAADSIEGTRHLPAWLAASSSLNPVLVVARHLRHTQAVCLHLQVRWRHRPCHPQD